MPKTFTSLDDVLFDRIFQPGADFISHRVRLALSDATCFCVDVASIAWMIARAPRLAEAFAARDISGSLADLALLSLGLAALVSLRMLFRRAGLKPANPLRQTMRRHRGVVLLMLVSRMLQLHTLELTVVADLVMLLGASAALYLGACAEPPPIRRALPGRPRFAAP